MWECIEVHSTMERPAGQVLGGGMGGFGGGSGLQFMKTRGFLPGASQSLSIARLARPQLGPFLS